MQLVLYINIFYSGREELNRVSNLHSWSPLGDLSWTYFLVESCYWLLPSIYLPVILSQSQYVREISLCWLKSWKVEITSVKLSLGQIAVSYVSSLLASLGDRLNLLNINKIKLCLFSYLVCIFSLLGLVRQINYAVALIRSAIT